MDSERWKYKWVIVVLSIISNAITSGQALAVGVLYKDWTAYFDSSASFLSLVGGSPIAVASIFGKIYSKIKNIRFVKPHSSGFSQAVL